jgi:hypothetical protein
MSDEPPHDEPFTMPLPPPMPPMPPGAEGDVVYFHRAVPAPPPSEGVPREHEDIMLRRVPADTARRFRSAAGGRGMTHAQYLAALVALHEAMRARADGGDAGLAEELERLGLSSVTV